MLKRRILVCYADDLSIVINGNNSILYWIGINRKNVIGSKNLHLNNNDNLVRF